MNSDIKQEAMAMRTIHKPFHFVNHLFEDLYLYLRPYENAADTRLLAKIPAHSSESIAIDPKGRRLIAGDVIYGVVKIINTCGKKKEYFAIPVFQLNESRKIIELGTISYDSYGDTNITMTGIASEIPNIRVRNRLRVPVDVYYVCGSDAKHIATIAADDNKNYMGGSASNMFLNNGSQGFRLGQILSFKLAGTHVSLYEYKLIDNYTKNLDIGSVRMHDGIEPSIPPLDRVSYSANGPMFHDLAYYKPVRVLGDRSSGYASASYRSVQVGGTPYQ